MSYFVQGVLFCLSAGALGHFATVSPDGFRSVSILFFSFLIVWKTKSFFNKDNQGSNKGNQPKEKSKSLQDFMSNFTPLDPPVKIKFHYMDAEGDYSERIVRVDKIYEDRYFSGYCYEANEPRTFKVSRLLHDGEVTNVETGEVFCWVKFIGLREK